VKEGEVIVKNIPMDPLKFDWNEFAKRDMKVMKFFSQKQIWWNYLLIVLFAVGLVFSLIATTILPSLFNFIILGIYFCLFVLRLFVLKPRPSGIVQYQKDNIPLAFAIIRAFQANTNQEITHKVTDQYGRYYCLVPNGKYYVKIDEKNIDESYTTVFNSGLIEVKKGYIKEKFKV